MLNNRNQFSMPTECTKEITEEICRYINQGSFPEIASSLAGIQPDTYRAWLKRGRKELDRLNKGTKIVKIDVNEEPFVEFYQLITEALAKTEQLFVMRLNASLSDPRITKWLLARRFRKRWGNNAKHNIISTSSVDNANDNMSSTEKVSITGKETDAELFQFISEQLK